MSGPRERQERAKSTLEAFMEHVAGALRTEARSTPQEHGTGVQWSTVGQENARSEPGARRKDSWSPPQEHARSIKHTASARHRSRLVPEAYASTPGASLMHASLLTTSQFAM